MSNCRPAPCPNADWIFSGEPPRPLPWISTSHRYRSQVPVAFRRQSRRAPTAIQNQTSGQLPTAARLLLRHHPSGEPPAADQLHHRSATKLPGRISWPSASPSSPALPPLNCFKFRPVARRQHLHRTRCQSKLRRPPTIGRFITGMSQLHHDHRPPFRHAQTPADLLFSGNLLLRPPLDATSSGRQWSDSSNNRWFGFNRGRTGFIGRRREEEEEEEESTGEERKF